MASGISFHGSNSGLQIGKNEGPVTVHFLQSETSLNQACLRDLRTTNPHDDKDRIKNTNGGLLKDSYCWILNNEEYKQWQDNQGSHLLWIRGDPGKGKTMLLCGIIEELARLIGENANISFFFCQATDTRINNATAVLRGLIYLLLEKQPSLLPYLRSRYDQAGKALFEDINAWNALSRIFTDILKDPTLQDTYLIIDALDECTADLSSLLGLIVQESPVYPNVKWIVSSRNWPDIEERLGTATRTAPISLELNETSVSEAVNKFIQHRVNQLAEVKRYNDTTRDTIHRHLSLNSQGTFLWVALVCQELTKTSSWNTLKRLKTFPPGLNALYSRMVDQIRDSEDAELCKRILALISIGYRPITLYELAPFIEIPNDLSSDYEVLSRITAICGSFLTLRDNTIIFVHQSAKEYLLREARNEIFPRGKEVGHMEIFSRSLKLIFRTLRRDILNIKFPGLPIKEVAQPSPNPLAAAEYACVHWVDHLQDGWCDENADLSLEDGGPVDDFLRQKYLHWLEALSILGSLNQGITAMLKLEGILQKNGEAQALLHRVQDASRFIRYHRLAIESSPLQVYGSPLIFSPTQSITRACYQKERPDWILNEPLAEKNWNPCLQTLEGHVHHVMSIAWSKDGSRLASGSHDNIIRVWDPANGQCTLTLKGHSGSIYSITWSQDRSRLASASTDKTVRIWHLATGRCILTLEGHVHHVISIAWSQGGSRLASGSKDKTVRIWDPDTGQCIWTLEGHSGPVMSIAWSQDGSRLASGSNDKTARIWDPVIGQCIFNIEGHSDSIISITWLQDGNRLASGSRDSIVRIWNTATGQCLSTIKGHTQHANSISWSQDRSRIASGSDDGTVMVWDPVTGHYISTLEGHTAPVVSIGWSQDESRLASASCDKTVRIWDLATGDDVSNFERHSTWVITIAWSQDGSRLASASFDKTARVWNSATGQCASTLKGHSGPVTSIAWSRDGSRLASGSDDNTVRIWDPTTGQCTSTLEGHSKQVNSIAWSQDGSRLASTSFDSTTKVWDLATGQCSSRIEGHSGWSITWSQDGSRLALASLDDSVKILDPSTGQCTLTLEGHSGWVKSIAWSQDGSRLASGSVDKTVRIWDPASGQCERTLPIHSPDFLHFDELNPNDLHTAIGTINLAPTGCVISTSTPHSLPSFPEIFGVGLNDDLSWITYNGVNLLFLPVEYRPILHSLFAISATTVAICCSSGRVAFISLSGNNPISRF